MRTTPDRACRHRSAVVGDGCGIGYGSIVAMSRAAPNALRASRSFVAQQEIRNERSSRISCVSQCMSCPGYMLFTDRKREA
ncbi:hypothetical protein HMPREF0762_00840 [Slackia exigua ATCC 700122]|uniref:Uncharacterized protein n=1 Tax=Slackia exigua (strain ATCC 700122 / DSM 15923 / CIP 105133 / JCM 11022 / KCTC 5966 / S-7) TaxID=649764 RepID=D0WG89_SLAES|nr:hypothetical protein HMPREF0762_00840 [Slackia exigua ATCC 700122]